MTTEYEFIGGCVDAHNDDLSVAQISPAAIGR